MRVFDCAAHALHSGNYSVGLYNVTYVAWDPSNNNATCTFNFTVYQTLQATDATSSSSSSSAATAAAAGGGGGALLVLIVLVVLFVIFRRNTQRVSVAYHACRNFLGLSVAVRVVFSLSLCCGCVFLIFLLSKRVFFSVTMVLTVFCRSCKRQPRAMRS